MDFVCGTAAGKAVSHTTLIILDAPSNRSGILSDGCTPQLSMLVLVANRTSCLRCDCNGASSAFFLFEVKLLWIGVLFLGGFFLQGFLGLDDSSPVSLSPPFPS